MHTNGGQALYLAHHRRDVLPAFAGTLLLLLLSVSSPGRAIANPAAVPRPSLVVSFQATSATAGETVPVSVWLANDSDQALSGTALFVTGPSFLKWTGGTRARPLADASLHLGALPPHSVSGPHVLRMTVRRAVASGDVNVVFAARYGWRSGHTTLRSLVTSEKSIHVASGVSPKPTLLVSFQRTSILVRERVAVTVGVVNDSDQGLSHAVLTVDSPPFLKWTASVSPGAAPVQAFSFGPVAAHAWAKKTIYVAQRSRTDAGLTDVLFLLHYQWNGGGAGQESVITSTQQVTVDFLGIDKVFGVPLSLASFVLPGLAFWMVLSLFRVPFTQNLDADVKRVMVVLLSIAILFVIHALGYFRRVSWITANLDASHEISLGKVFALCVVGVALAFIVWGAWNICGWCSRKSDISPGDSLPTLLEKILRRSPYRGKGISSPTSRFHASTFTRLCMGRTFQRMPCTPVTSSSWRTRTSIGRSGRLAPRFEWTIWSVGPCRIASWD